VYQAIHSTERLHVNDVSVKYPDKYILMLFDEGDDFIGTIEYIGDDDYKLYDLQDESENPTVRRVIEGLELQKRIGLVTRWLKPCH
jgi:hypothetical protein